MSDLLPENPPTPENGYTVAPEMEMTADLWNLILSSIHERLAAREEVEAEFESLISTGTSAALTMIQENIAPQLATLVSTIGAALAEITIITEGVAPNSVLLNSQPASYYLNPENFSTSATIKSLMSASNAADARAAIGVSDAISAALAAFVSGAPAALDTLQELAAALGNDPNFATTVSSAIGERLAKAGGTMTGSINMGGHKVAGADWSDEFSSATDVRAGTSGKWVTPDANHAALAFVSLTDAAMIAVDHAEGVNRKVTLGGNRVFDAPTNAKVGLPLTILIEQDGAGNRVLAWHQSYKFGDYGTPALSTGAGHADLVTFVCVAADRFIFMGIRRRVD